ncbi:hypothetical protein ACIA5H_37110 [Nocardia sp. NPDC051900]|uniref:hypothetical protein n=1 Tax=Nocardia sp. NPDC051900 TaxID=3364326 RepID=UPI0037B33BDC
MPRIHRIRAATIAELRDLAARARAETFEPGWPYDERGPAVWSDCVHGLLGGALGDYCAAIHPDLLVTLLDELERLLKEVP